jgi:RNA ligase
MKLYDYVDADKLSKQITDGMVKEQVHPSLPLRILNYTQKAQYTPELWNEVTDKCRGLIFNSQTNEIVARGFVKFWNYSDLRHQETMPENYPATVPIITRKMDGSLGILYCNEGKWAVATRGSFASEQAAWATKWLNNHPLKIWPDGFTPLVEIIFPENQIVVKYDWSGLVLLAGVRIKTGEEMTREVLEELGSRNGMRVVDKFDKSVDACAAEDVDNEEGYVVAWTRPGTWPLRVKVKMETYCRLHRLLTGTNPATVWEMLKDGLDLTTVTTDVPVDFVTWIRSVEDRLVASYKAIEKTALAAILEYSGEMAITTPDQRKQFALYAAEKRPVTPILFAMLDRKDYAPIIWKMVKPRGDDKTFKVDIDI